ncbi:MAG: class I poly(R)-hydroxyalkanoic acid synthase [Agarilytica sp.]
MNSEEKHKILDYVDKYSGVFNDMIAQVTRRMMNSQHGEEQGKGLNMPDLSLHELATTVKVDPQKFVTQQIAFLEKQKMLWQNASKVFMGEDFEPVIQESRGDKRFSDEDWVGNPAFNYIKQAYLLNAEYMNQLVGAMEFEDKGVEEQVRFYTRQFINSVSPSNYVLTNPEVCREILSTQGENLAKGVDNFMRDLDSSPSEAFRINQVNCDAFELGKDLAHTPGKVVFQNELIQLIQYTPTTEQVYKTPLLIIPPFINKFYIMDLDKKKSMVAWLVEQGYTVFMISWINPDESFKDFPFDDYINKGAITALDVVEEITAQKKINAVGYCVGGTVLGITQAYLATLNDTRLNSLTFFTTLFDFSEPGEVGTYLTKQMIPMVEQSVNNNGYLDGRILGLGFSLLRENNLFWSFFIENYLKGKDPMPFDILYWNSDSTNLPAQAFLFYLNNMYMENRLIEKGGVTINDTPIDLKDITIPCYALAAQADHIVLWQAAYQSSKSLGGDVRFVLTESGHVAGVINPASRGKYGHWTNDDKTENAAEWLTSADQHDGSWWNDWHVWLSEKSGTMVKAKKVGAKKKYPVLEDAPGSYVKKRLDGV